MAANPITRTRLRRLADVHPDRGRVLSVFLNLDPTEFATPAARSTAITSLVTQALRRVRRRRWHTCFRCPTTVSVSRVNF